MVTERTTTLYLVADFEPLWIGLTNIIEEEPSLKLLGAANSMEEMAFRFAPAVLR